MKRPALGLLAAVLALVSSASAQAPAPRWIVAATYLNDPAHEAQARALRAVLDAHGIHSVTTCSAGCTLSVEEGRYREALRLLEAEVARASLDVAVVVPGTS